MKKTALICILALGALLGHSQDTVSRTEIFNGYDNPVTTVTIFTSEEGGWYIEMRDEGGPSYGIMELGSSREEARRTLKHVRNFIESDEIEYMLIRKSDGDYLKLYKEEKAVNYYDEMEEEYTEIWVVTVITDGTDSFSDIPLSLVKRVLGKL